MSRTCFTLLGMAKALLVVALTISGCEAQMAALSGRTAISPGDFADTGAEANLTQEAASMPAFSEPAEATFPDNAVIEGAAIEGGEFVAMAPGVAPEPIEDEDAQAVAEPTSSEPTERVTPIISNAPPADDSTSGAGRRVIVDSLIGQVNGRPIFADEFFEPIEDQILAARDQLPAQEFLATMEGIINERLQQVIFNELVLAEAETMLTEEMRVGLRFWLKDVEEKRLAESLGVRARAEEELAEEGMTLDEFLALKEDEAKIYTLVKKKIEPRVIVTWRDMQREFERRAGEFNPKASVTLAKIVLNKELEAELVDEVSTGLAGGKSFEEVGKGLSRSSAYSEDTYQLGEQGLAGLPLNPKILEAIEGLEVGETAEPVEVEIRSSQPQTAPRVTVYWYHIKHIEQREARTLYDPAVQRQLYNELYNRRLAEERQRYLNSLLGKGIYDDTTEMSLRLRRVALMRYGRR